MVVFSYCSSWGHVLVYERHNRACAAEMVDVILFSARVDPLCLYHEKRLHSELKSSDSALSPDSALPSDSALV